MASDGIGQHGIVIELRTKEEGEDELPLFLGKLEFVVLALKSLVGQVEGAMNLGMFFLGEKRMLKRLFAVRGAE